MARNKPLTVNQVASRLCFRCRLRPGAHQWNICADGYYRAICRRCDITLNRLVLRFMRVPHAEDKMRRYVTRYPV